MSFVFGQVFQEYVFPENSLDPFTGLIAIIFSSCVTKQDGKHLFMLSGQSNMAGLRPEKSFTPAIEDEFGEENVFIVKDAPGGQPIRRWYRD